VLDLRIDDATIVDGTGSPRRHGSIGVRDGMIVATDEVTESATHVVAVDGQIVAPGFVDLHTHLDVQGFWDPFLTPTPFHGVTTVFGGNCGFTVAPISSETGDYMMRMLARVEGMPLEALAAGAPWDWGSTGDYLDRLDGRLALNAGFMVGHSAIRRLVMGGDANARPASAAELDAMESLLRDGLRAGGFGFSTSTSPTHNDGDGNRVPSRSATSDEFVRLASVVAEFPGTSLEILPGVVPFEAHEVDRMIAMSVAARRPINWNPLEVSELLLNRALDALAAGDRATEVGGRIVALTPPVTLPLRFSFSTGVVLDALPGWGEVMALPPAAKLQAMRDPQVRRRLEALAAEPNRFSAIACWDERVIAEVFSGELKRYEGRRVADIASEFGVSPFEALVEIACQDDLQTTFSPIIDDSPGDWRARVHVWRDGRAIIGASDTGAHLDFLPSFNITTRLLGEGVREEQALPLEEAVAYISRTPAEFYGLRDRGTLAAGMRADLVVFDEGTVGGGPVHTRFDLPGGAGRLYGEATGISRVVVNGVDVLVDGELTGATPGTLLRSGRDSSTPHMTLRSGRGPRLGGNEP
jgi:N-acyl-D-aspartate/D-glutamate deacylase